MNGAEEHAPSVAVRHGNGSFSIFVFKLVWASYHCLYGKTRRLVASKLIKLCG
jgi:hypothetical protein